jgi:hypothetical protein
MPPPGGGSRVADGGEIGQQVASFGVAERGVVGELGQGGWDPGRSCLFHTIPHYVTNLPSSPIDGALGPDQGIALLSKSHVSEMAKTLHGEVAALQARATARRPVSLLWMDALAVKCREVDGASISPLWSPTGLTPPG